MNIFCNNIHESEATISDFLGKNIWVFCRVYGHISYWAYVRFVRKGVRLYDCNILPESDIGHYSGVGELGISSIFIETISISRPLETKTTEELFGEDIAAHNIEIFKRFENKPYWIYVTTESLSDWWYSYYITVDKLDGIVVEGRVYKDFHVDLYESVVTPEDVKYEDYPSEMYEHVIMAVDNFRIKEPLDLLSNTEVREMLNDNDYLYEAMLAENNVEDDEEDDDLGGLI